MLTAAHEVLVFPFFSSSEPPESDLQPGHTSLQRSAQNKANSLWKGGGVLDVYPRPTPTRLQTDKMNLTANVKITDNHKSRKRASGVDDES